MPIIIVWHLGADVNQDTRCDITAPCDSETRAARVQEAFEAGLYEEMCRVEVADGDNVEAALGRAYTLTQNGVVSPSWTLEPPVGVTPLGQGIRRNGQVYGYRSTSVGDVMETEDGRLFTVDSFGFAELPQPPAATPAPCHVF